MFDYLVLESPGTLIPEAVTDYFEEHEDDVAHAADIARQGTGKWERRREGKEAKGRGMGAIVVHLG